jgi:hypothetical protein
MTATTESRADLKRYRQSMRATADRLEREARKKVADAIAKMRGDLDWIGPRERQMGVVVLPRELAMALLHWCEQKWREDDEARKAKDSDKSENKNASS